MFAAAIRLARRRPKRSPDPQFASHTLHPRRVIVLRITALFANCCSRKRGGLMYRTAPPELNSSQTRPAFHLRKSPENHPFLWDFKAFWNSSFTKLGSRA